MPSHLRRHALQQFLQQVDPAGSGGGMPPAAPPEPPKPEEPPLGDAGKAALDAERKAARAAEARAKTAERELADLKAAKAKEEEDKQAEQGEWKSLAEKRDADLKAVSTERERLTSRVETLEALAAGRLKDLMAAIPKEIAELGPDDSTPIEQRLAWAEKAAKAAALTTGTEPGNGPGPKPSGATKPDLRGVLPRRQLIN